MILRQPTLEQIQDVAVRESLQWFLDYLQTATFLQGEWKYFELTFDVVTSTQVKIPHGLPFVPKDIIQTAVVQTGASVPVVSFQAEKFDKTHLYITTEHPCVVRFFAGRYSA
jgi:hypothetical protein